MKAIFTTLFFLSLLISNVSAQNQANFFDSTIYIYGKILNLPKTASSKCVVQLLDDQGLLAEQKLRPGRKTFDFELHRQSNYVIRILQEGRQPKIMVVNTVMPKGASGIFDFAFNVNMQTLDEAQELTTYAIELPVALIRYDLLAETFVYDLSFATQARLALYRHKNHLTTESLVMITE